MAYELITFEDLLDAVAEELKLDPNDTVEINRIKRDINAAYLDHVVPFKRWPWLTGHTQVEHKPYLANGTVSVTPDSTTITFSTAPTTSKTGYLFAVDSFSEVYQISSHTAGATTATLSSPWTGTLLSGVTYKVWTDQVVLPVDCRETVEVYHSFFRQPMEGVGLQEFRRRVAEEPFKTGRPEFYSTYDFVGEEDATRYRVMKVYPSILANSTTLSIDYVREVTPLDLDSDEPVMPQGDRVVLVYGALVRAWKRMRNPEASEQSRRDFLEKLAQMAGRVEDSQDNAQLTPSSRYLSRKRGRGVAMKSISATGSGSYSAPSYLKNPVIEGASVTANITVNSGITIDGRDVSADGATLDAHVAGTTDVHDASAISVTPSGGLTSTDVQGALQELQAEIGTFTALNDGNIFMGNASNEAAQVTVSGDVTIDNTGVAAIASGAVVNADINANAAIEFSKMEALTASRAMVTDGAGEASASSVTATELGYVAGVTSAIQTQLNAKASDADLTLLEGDVLSLDSALTSHTGASSGVHGVTGNVVGTTDTQTLSNKTLTSPTINTPTVDVATLDGQGSTPSSPSAGFYKLYVDDTTSRLQLLDSSGTVSTVGSGSGGGINYIENPDAEAATTGWATYADAAGTSPVDGTGGTANVTWTRSTSSPLRGLASFLLTKDAADRQGEGASYDFTIDSADQAKVMQLNFDYAVASGTYATGDVAIYIVDVTNSTVIQPSAYQVENVGVNSTARLTFQTASNSTSYRLCFHVASTSASAYSLKFDNIQLGPQVVPMGAPVTDFTSYSVTVDNLGTGSTVTNSGFWRRVGDSMQIVMRVTKDTNTGSGSAAVSFSIPSGYTIDTSKLPSTSIQTVGFVTDIQAGTTGSVVYRNTTSVYLYNMTAGGGQWNGSAFSANKTVNLVFMVPIVGWSSSTVVSSSADTRVVAATMTRNAAAFSAASAITNWNTTVQDTHGMVNLTNGSFTIKVPGTYQVTLFSNYNTANGIVCGPRVNGATPPGWTNDSTTFYKNVNFDFPNLKAGDVVDFYTGSGSPPANGSFRASISLVQGPSQIAMSEIIACRYTSTSGNTLTTTPTVQDFATKTYDTHSAVTTGASWKFTAPAPGYYRVAVATTTAATTTALGVIFELFKNGVFYSQIARNDKDSTTSSRVIVQGVDTIYLLAGEYIDIRNYVGTSTLALNTTAGQNYITVERLGGVM